MGAGAPRRGSARACSSLLTAGRLGRASPSGRAPSGGTRSAGSSSSPAGRASRWPRRSWSWRCSRSSATTAGCPPASSTRWAGWPGKTDSDRGTDAVKTVYGWREDQWRQLARGVAGVVVALLVAIVPLLLNQAVHGDGLLAPHERSFSRPTPRPERAAADPDHRDWCRQRRSRPRCGWRSRTCCCSPCSPSMFARGAHRSYLRDVAELAERDVMMATYAGDARDRRRPRRDGAAVAAFVAACRAGRWPVRGRRRRLERASARGRRARPGCCRTSEDGRPGRADVPAEDGAPPTPRELRPREWNGLYELVAGRRDPALDELDAAAHASW